LTFGVHVVSCGILINQKYLTMTLTKEENTQVFFLVNKELTSLQRKLTKLENENALEFDTIEISIIRAQIDRLVSTIDKLGRDYQRLMKKEQSES